MGSDGRAADQERIGVPRNTVSRTGLVAGNLIAYWDD
jgi:hypothetical protein